jgi:cyclic-di-AMP phosphodiesterase PgpH
MAADSFLMGPHKRRPGRVLVAQDIPWRARVRFLGGWLLTLVLCALILVAPLPLSGQVLLQVGDVARSDVMAPRGVTYVSDILIKQRQDLAASAVPAVYDAPQARIGRQQLTIAGQLLDFVGSVRSDSYGDAAAKAENLRSINSAKLSPEAINRILSMSNTAWDRAANEIQNVLEAAMRDEIRDNNLADERRKVASLVRLDLPDDDAAVVREIVQDLLVPNSFYNADKTDQLRQEARQRVEQVTTTIARNEVILRAGDIVAASDVEALDALGLRQATWGWQELRGALAFLFLLGVVFLYYLWKEKPVIWLARAESLLLALSLILFLLAARLVIPAHALLPYMFPYAALTMILSVMVGLDLALVTTGFFVLLVGWLTGGSLELMAYAFCAALVGALTLRRGERLGGYAWAAAYVAVAAVLVVGAFRLVSGELDRRGLAELTSAAVVNGLVTMTVTLLGVYLAGIVLGIITPLQLLDISRPTHPLLRQLLLKAPGTYHHTLLVSNMAERAAEAIGADGQLARVGAYYHDVGKTIRPYFFIENRDENLDPHARLDPYTSAQIIISHVTDGIELARKYRLPHRIIDFIPEHQGTLLVHYFYYQAVKAAGSAGRVDKAQFTYPGPRPQSRETAITMLADGVEATVRARHPASMEEMAQIIAESVQSRIDAGQLDECSLTLSDLHEIRRAFLDVLRGLHHPRITYPSDPVEELAPAAPAVAATALAETEAAHGEG